MQIITVDESRCVGCNACVRVCPVHANVTRLKEGTTDEFVTGIDSEACINCGECVKVCMHHARGYKDNLKEFTETFESNKPMILIVAPAIRTSFPDGAWRVLLSWLRQNGNCKIYDVGYGADICTFMYNKYITENGGKKLVTQPCPAIVNYMQKYQPEKLEYLSPVLSPAGCLAVWLRKYKGETRPMFMLSPCIAKTSEAQREHTFDYNVTFRHLEKYVSKKGIQWEDRVQFEFDAVEGSIGRLYPMPGGLKENLAMLNQGLIVRNAEGPHSVYDRLDRYFQTEDKQKPDVLDVLNCEYGCNHGTALPSEAATLMEIESTMDDIATRSIRETQGGFLGIGRFKRFKEFDKNLKLSDFLTKYHDERVYTKNPTMDDYTRIFDSMRKFDIASQSVNCGACGYKTCRDMACAIFRGMNVRENCIYYLKHSLKSNYKKLKKVYDACVEEMLKINQVSIQISTSQEDILSSTNDISHKSEELCGNISRLQKFCQSCLQYYQNKQADSLTQEDFAKMQQFITAIGTMTQSYYDVAKDFADRSGDIHEQIQTMSVSLSELSELSDKLQHVMTQDTEA
ncbi:MAG: 4Fe-4S binding protein [Oscillospiraceae bacterium]|nr:4Fe-4S binding protein [Oscillospiraceae bacterium]